MAETVKMEKEQVSTPLTVAASSENSEQESHRSWLRSKLVELFSAEFKRMKADFERTSQQASDELAKCRAIGEAMRQEQDNERKIAMQDDLIAQRNRAENVNRQVHETNMRMLALKTQFEARLAKVAEKESKRDSVLETMANEESRAMCSASFARLSKLLFVPHVDRSAVAALANNFFGNQIEEIYAKSPVYELQSGTALTHCPDFHRFMAYSQKRFINYLCRDNNFDPAIRQLILGILFRVLDEINAESGCSIVPNYKVKDDLIGYDGSVDYAVEIDGKIRAFLVKVELGDGLEIGLPRLLASLDSAKLDELMLKQSSEKKSSHGVVTDGQYWQLVRLNHMSGEFQVSETLGPVDICYCETGPENDDHVLPLCRNILAMLQESIGNN